MSQTHRLICQHVSAIRIGILGSITSCSAAAGAQVPDGLRADPVDGARGRGCRRAAGHPCGAAGAGRAAARERAAAVAPAPARPHTCVSCCPLTFHCACAPVAAQCASAGSHHIMLHHPMAPLQSTLSVPRWLPATLKLILERTVNVQGCL